MCLLVGVIHNCGWQILSRRSLTNAQVSVALRPFYFLVHPDLFVRHPKEQLINENSLKSLKYYLEEAKNKRKNNSNFKFYVKNPLLANSSSCINRSNEFNNELRSVQFELSESHDVKSAVSKVLETFNLPTNYIDSIKQSPKIQQFFSDDIEPSVHRKTSPRDSSEISLQDWLQNNVENARKKLSDCTPFRLEIERIRSQICTQFQIRSIQWDCDLNALHCRGALDSFKILVEGHEEVCQYLKDKNIIFGRKSGMSLEGDIILFSGEIRYNWLNTIRQVPREEEELSKIPILEKMLSELLLNIQISHREFHPLTTVEDYRIRLRKVITAVNDVIGTGGRPNNLDLSDFKISIESESSPLMLAPSGEFVAPASTPGFLLINFITEHLEEAQIKLKDYQLKKKEENDLIQRCIKELGLIKFDKDDSITSDAMIDSCNRLLRNSKEIKHLSHGNHFIMTRYFSVQSDGSICLPFNWKEN